MATFPQLQSGAVAQYPSTRHISFSTFITPFVDGSEQRFRDFPASVQRWTIRLDRLTAAELDAVESFFDSQSGEFSSFTFVDPWDETEYPDCSFEGPALSTVLRGETHGAATFTIRNNQA
jgi:hypothetical protein